MVSSAPLRPQEPQRPFPYREEEAGIENSAQGIHLAGTLTLPPGKGPFPAVLLITGSGLQDRDEEVFGHKPFLVLADYLTRRGIAVLRVDDRGIGGSTSKGPATDADLATDAVACLRYLRSRSDIGPVGLIGHSTGALVAQIAASKADEVDLVVMLAGPGIPGNQIVKLQSELIARASGVPESVIATNSKLTAAGVDAVAQSPTPQEAAVRARDALEKAAAELPEPSRSRTRASIANQVALLSSPWMHHFLRFDPRATLRHLRCPILALNGTLDLQVPAAANLPAIAGALAAAGNHNVTTTALPGLNHLFQTAKTGLPSEYGLIDETMSPTALRTIGDWLTRRWVEGPVVG